MEPDFHSIYPEAPAGFWWVPEDADTEDYGYPRSELAEGWSLAAVFNDEEGFTDYIFQHKATNQLRSAEGDPHDFLKPQYRKKCWHPIHPKEHPLYLDTRSTSGSWLGRDFCPDHGPPPEASRAFFQATLTKYGGWSKVPPEALHQAEQAALKAWV